MRSRNRNKGQSLVEFALIFPFVFLLITGFLDVSRAVFAYATISNAVREGTRYASVNKAELIKGTAYPPDNTVIIDKVKSYSVGVKTSQMQVTVVITKSPTDTFEKISISATYLFTPITPGLKQILGASAGIPIKAQSTMRIAQGSR